MHEKLNTFEYRKGEQKKAFLYELTIWCFQSMSLLFFMAMLLQ